MATRPPLDPSYGPSSGPGAPPARNTALPAPRLWRSASNRVVLGVIGGLAEKFGLEAKPLRILGALFGVLTLPIGGLPVIVPYLTIWGITKTRGVRGPAQPLRRSRTNQVVAGVLGGVSEWLGAKPALVRVGFSALTLATFVLPGVVTYLALWAKLRVADPLPAPESR